MMHGQKNIKLFLSCIKKSITFLPIPLILNFIMYYSIQAVPFITDLRPTISPFTGIAMCCLSVPLTATKVARVTTVKPLSTMLCLACRDNTDCNIIKLLVRQAGDFQQHHSTAMCRWYMVQNFARTFVILLFYVVFLSLSNQ